MEMTILDVLHIVLKRLWLIITAVVLAFTIALSYCVFIARPVYSAKATILIASGVLFNGEDTRDPADYITTGELSTSFALMKSISGILNKSMEYYETALEVAEETGALNHSYTAAALKSGTSISYEEESIILTVTVKTYDREDTAILIAALAECTPNAVTSRLGRTSADVLHIDERASRVAPNTPVTCVIGAFVGLLLSVLAAIVIEKFDKTVKGEDDFIKNHKYPLLGCVPDFETKNKRRTVD